MTNSSSKIAVEVSNIASDLKGKHNDYIRALRDAKAAIEREIAAHEAEDAAVMPSTSIGGGLMCNRMDDAQRISDDMTALAGKLSMLNYLARD